LILRFQTRGPTNVWLASNEILITPSAVLDAEPDTLENIREYWERAQELLLDWIARRIRPAIIEPLIKRLR